MGRKYKCPYCEVRKERKDLITHIDELNNLIDYKDFLLKNTQDSLAEEQKKSNHYRELLDNI